MRSSPYRTPSGRMRRWLGPVIALVISVGLGVLPSSVKTHTAAALERTIFQPFRFTVGWGARALAGAGDARRLSRQLTEREWNAEEGAEVRVENDRLRRLLGFGRRAEFALVPCDVVGRERSRVGDVLLIEPVEAQAAEPGLAVVSPDGLVGRVSLHGGRYPRVECLAHVQIAVSVVNQRTREGGILKWSPEHRPGLVIGGIPSQSDWREGDRIITSGLGTAFPRGVLVGWVEGTRASRGGLLKEVRVRASASPDRVGEVFLLRRADASPAFPRTEDDAQDVSAYFPVEPKARVARFLFGGKVDGEPGPLPVP